MPSNEDHRKSCHPDERGMRTAGLYEEFREEDLSDCHLEGVGSGAVLRHRQSQLEVFDHWALFKARNKGFYGEDGWWTPLHKENFMRWFGIAPAKSKTSLDFLHPAGT